MKMPCGLSLLRTVSISVTALSNPTFLRASTSCPFMLTSSSRTSLRAFHVADHHGTGNLPSTIATLQRYSSKSSSNVSNSRLPVRISSSVQPSPYVASNAYILIQGIFGRALGLRNAEVCGWVRVVKRRAEVNNAGFVSNKNSPTVSNATMSQLIG